MAPKGCGEGKNAIFKCAVGQGTVFEQPLILPRHVHAQAFVCLQDFHQDIAVFRPVHDDKGQVGDDDEGHNNEEQCFVGEGVAQVGVCEFADAEQYEDDESKPSGDFGDGVEHAPERGCDQVTCASAHHPQFAIIEHNARSGRNRESLWFHCVFTA